MTLASTQPKPFVFAIMPFSHEFDDIYLLGIKAAAEEAGAYCERADEQIHEEVVVERVYNQISKADLLVADLTGRNANVSYEVGYAHALGKNVILVTKDLADVPFDLRHLSHVVYSGKISALKQELSKRITWFIEHPTQHLNEPVDDLGVFLDGNELARDDGVVIDISGLKTVELSISIHNRSTQVLEENSFEIGIVTPGWYPESWDGGGRSFRRIFLPDAQVLHILPSLKKLYPQAWESFVYNTKTRWSAAPVIENSLSSDMYVRFFSNAGQTDFPFKVSFRDISLHESGS